MPLLFCPDCRKEVQLYHKSCPHCGRLHLPVSVHVAYTTKKYRPRLAKQKTEQSIPKKSPRDIYYRNPVNGYEECGVTNLSPVWAFLFGSFYWIFRGVWHHALLSFLLALMTMLISHFIYPFFTHKIMRSHYARQGWIEINDFDKHNIKE